MSRFSSRANERMQQCFTILERAANAGVKCPTNADLAELMGYNTIGKPAEWVVRLERAGLIEVERRNTGRVVTIVATGKKTAELVMMRQVGGWTAEQDEILMEAASEDRGFTAVGRQLGKSRSACISRFYKVAASMGAQAC